VVSLITDWTPYIFTFDRKEARPDLISFLKTISIISPEWNERFRDEIFRCPVKNDFPSHNDMSRATPFKLNSSLQFIDAIWQRHFDRFSHILREIFIVASGFILRTNPLIGSHSMLFVRRYPPLIALCSIQFV
jgi:hypothetical protein